MNWLPSIAAAVVFAQGAWAASGYTPTREELLDFGIIITNCVRDTRGVRLAWVTAHDGPFHVGVYPAYDWSGLGYLEEVATSARSAYVPGDFTDMPVLVKVITAGRIEELSGWDYGDGGCQHRRLTAEERRHFLDVCRRPLRPDRNISTAWRDGDYDETWTPSVVFPRYFSCTCNGVTYTNTASAATTTISFKSTPVPSSVPDEDDVVYWTRSTITVDSYDPSSRNEWCWYASGKKPWAGNMYLTYKNGPVFAVNPEVWTNVVGVVTNEHMNYTTATNLKLLSGTILSPNIAMPTVQLNYAPRYQSFLVTNVWTTAEYNAGWELHPFQSPAPGREMLWEIPSHRADTSQSIYLPRLFKGIPGDGPHRATTSFFGEAIIVTNTPSHWESDFGIEEIPPGSNNLFRIHHDQQN